MTKTVWPILVVFMMFSVMPLVGVIIGYFMGKSKSKNTDVRNT